MWLGVAGVEANLNGHWARDGLLDHGDPRDSIREVANHLANHSYFYQSCTGDQRWTTDPNDSASLVSMCSKEQLGSFLLSVEPGCFLGTNGWDAAYDKPLGAPLGPAYFQASLGEKPATLARNFTSGTFVVFTYDKSGKDGSSEVFWGGLPPPPPPPPPPTIVCSACGSTLLRDTTFAYDDVVAATTEHDESACCGKCASHGACTQWAWHGGSDKSCHLHGSKSTLKVQRGTIAGVMNRTSTIT